KTYIETCTALSIVGDFYAPSYQERARLAGEGIRRKMPALLSTIPDLIELIQKATDFKLKDLKNPFHSDDIQEIWLKTKNDLLQTLSYLFKYLGITSAKSRIKSEPIIMTYLKSSYYQGFLSYHVEQGHKLVSLLRPILPIMIQAREHLRYQIQRRRFLNIFTGIRSPRFYIYTAAWLLLKAVRNNKKDVQLNIDALKLQQARHYLKHVINMPPRTSNMEKEWHFIRKRIIAAQNSFLLSKRQKTTL
ncbi:MAG: hypothetical protein ACXQS8_04995, partial [Candidatus Helarchaeales archaeon]